MTLWVLPLIAAVLLGWVFGFKVRGLGGALSLGCAAILIDYYCLWLRFRLFQKNRAGLWWIVSGGFLGRLLNVILFVEIANRQLRPDVFYIFGSFLVIAIPVWNLLISRRLGGMNTGSPK